MILYPHLPNLYPLLKLSFFFCFFCSFIAKRRRWGYQKNWISSTDAGPSVVRLQKSRTSISGVSLRYSCLHMSASWRWPLFWAFCCIVFPCRSVDPSSLWPSSMWTFSWSIRMSLLFSRSSLPFPMSRPQAKEVTDAHLENVEVRKFAAQEVEMRKQPFLLWFHIPFRYYDCIIM